MLQRTKSQPKFRAAQIAALGSGTQLPRLQLLEIPVANPGIEMLRDWMRMTSDAFMLGLETQRVIGLRLVKLSRGGGAAEAEALRMVTEKTSALAEAGMTLARGGSAGS